jgi:hypothetical protein
MTEQHHAYVSVDVAAAAEAAHRALNSVDDGWHLTCLHPDNDGPTTCYRGHAERQMLVADVMPAVLDALVEAGWTPPAGEARMVGFPSRPTRFVVTDEAP